MRNLNNGRLSKAICSKSKTQTVKPVKHLKKTASKKSKQRTDEEKKKRREKKPRSDKLQCGHTRKLTVCPDWKIYFTCFLHHYKCNQGWLAGTFVFFRELEIRKVKIDEKIKLNFFALFTTPSLSPSPFQRSVILI